MTRALSLAGIPMRLRFITALLVSLSTAACTVGTEPVTVPTIETTGFAPSLGVDLTASTKKDDGLYYRDIQIGTGDSLAFGDSVGVYYTASLANGTMFDQLRPVDSTSVPLQFRIGGLKLIPGFEEGVMGMKVGGVRQLIIPPQLGFWSTQLTNNGVVVVPAYSILVFNVNAVAKY